MFEDKSAHELVTTAKPAQAKDQLESSKLPSPEKFFQAAAQRSSPPAKEADSKLPEDPPHGQSATQIGDKRPTSKVAQSDPTLEPKQNPADTSKRRSLWIIEDGVPGSQGHLQGTQRNLNAHMQLVAASAQVGIEKKGTSNGSVQLFDTSSSFFSVLEIKKLQSELKPGDIVNISVAGMVQTDSLTKIPGLEHITSENLRKNSDLVIDKLNEYTQGLSDSEITPVIIINRKNNESANLPSGMLKSLMYTRESIEGIARDGNEVFIGAGNTGNSEFFNIYGLTKKQYGHNITVVGSEQDYSSRNSTVDIYNRNGKGLLSWNSEGNPQWSLNGKTIQLSPTSSIQAIRVDTLSEKNRDRLAGFNQYANSRNLDTKNLKFDESSEHKLIKTLNLYANKLNLPQGTYRSSDVLHSLPSNLLKQIETAKHHLLNYKNKKFEFIPPPGTSRNFS